MKHVRITYPGAYHHVMNRGYDGNAIFDSDQNKTVFLDLLEESVEKLKINVFAFCIMNNHYHLILENSSGRMSDFMMRLNGLFGKYYRKISGGKGYVFQDRFKSTLIEDDSYLITAILYILQNPVRAKIVKLPENYNWSSVNYYFSKNNVKIIDADYVNDLFKTKDVFLSSLHSIISKDQLSIKPSKYGVLQGNKDSLNNSIRKFDRRKIPMHQSKGVKRINERYFEPIEKVIMEFENKHKIKFREINTKTLSGKRQRAKLLMYLRDRAGLKYKEIAEFEIFNDLSFASLRSIYRSKKE